MFLKQICLSVGLILAQISTDGVVTKPAKPNGLAQRARVVTGKRSASASPANYVAADRKTAMKITLKASRDQSTAGSTFGVTAEIENISSHPIYVLPSTIAMTVPPELDDNGPHDLWAFVPGLPASPGQDYWSTVIVLEPGSTISTFWSGGRGNLGGSPDPNRDQSWREKSCKKLGLDCHTFFRGLGFSPGRYTLSIVASYWDTYEGAAKKSIERHTETAEIQETITSPESVILFGAALGGIIAFLLLTKLQPSSTSGWASVRWIPGSLSAVLLSTIGTILIARLSQSQFIISVTVNDFWGAIAVGFIITAAGPSILRRFGGLLNANQAQESSHTKPGAPAPSRDPKDKGDAAAQPNLPDGVGLGHASGSL